MLRLFNDTSTTIFGLTPGERLQRQVGDLETLIIADGSAVLDERSIAWLREHPGKALISAKGRMLALATTDDQFDNPDSRRILYEAAGTNQSSLPPRFVRKLRRKARPLAISLEETSSAHAEWLLYKSVYKGVTDLVTKWAWPVPAYYVTKAAARFRIPPNAVTIVGLLLTILAGYLFYEGSVGLGLAAAWAMTFLDTVDGKLARVTVTSSRLGNWLDHGTDVIHPPAWWICLARGLTENDPEAVDVIWTSCWLVLASYIVGRLIEVSFHRFFGFNGYLLSHIDALFRLIVARRNIILLIISVGLLTNSVTEAFIACAVWSVACVVFQTVRLFQAFAHSKRSELRPYIAT